MRRSIEYIGGRPLMSLWIGLQVNLLLYWWLASEPHTAVEWFSHAIGIAGAISLLNLPGAWLAFPLVALFPAPRSASETDARLLVAWVMSAGVTYFFWKRIAGPFLRRLNEQSEQVQWGQRR